MASWIVHLRIAERILAGVEEFDPAMLAIGNIAPDSGLPDDKWENFEPPVEVTHFTAENDNNFECEDMRFYNEYLAQEEQNGNAERYSFRWGYFFHLVTDNLWRQRIAKPTKERFKEEFAADDKFIWEVKKDWYGLDFIYVRDHPSSMFWRWFVKSDVQESYLDFLPIEALHERIKYIKEYYQRQDEKVRELYKRPYIYLSKAAMDEFVNCASEKLLSIYQYLSAAKRNKHSCSSALELSLSAT